MSDKQVVLTTDELGFIVNELNMGKKEAINAYVDLKKTDTPPENIVMKAVVDIIPQYDLLIGKLKGI